MVDGRRRGTRSAGQATAPAGAFWREHDLEERRAREVARRAAAPPPASRRGGPGARRRRGRSRAPGASSSRKVGSPERSARSTRVLTKKPISPSSSRARLRFAIGRADDDVRPARVQRREERLEGGEEDHEQGRALAPGQRLELCGRRAAGSGDSGAAAARSAGPAARGRSVGSSRAAGAPASCRASRRAAVRGPRRSAARAARRRSRRTGTAAPAAARLAGREGVVDRRQLAGEDAHRPAVGDGVVHGRVVVGPRPGHGKSVARMSGPRSRSKGGGAPVGQP